MPSQPRGISTSAAATGGWSPPHAAGGTIWPRGGAGFADLLGPVLARPDLVPPATQRLPPHLDFERDAGGLVGLLRAAGLVDVAAREISWTWRVSPADLWAGIEAGHATPGRIYQAQTPGMRALIAQDFFDAAAARSIGGMLRFDARAVMGVGRVS